MLTITVNGQKREVASPPETPLLYVLRNELGIMSPKFGCGLAQCGACSVLLGDAEIRSCVTPVKAAASADKEVTTVEGLPARWAKQQGRAGRDVALHPVQEAWIEQQVPQCGFCQFGMMIKATELLEQNPTPTDADIKAALTTSGSSAHLCRCGSYLAILDGVRHAVSLIAKRDGAK
jgi:aerobic-type carbon monoxide dehydrogenase small subunit (CoxS/CutS family)